MICEKCNTKMEKKVLLNKDVPRGTFIPITDLEKMILGYKCPKCGGKNDGNRPTND